MSQDDEVPASELILYQTEDRRTRVEVRLAKGTVWLTQAQLAELYQTSVQNVNAHLLGIYEEGELDGDATIKSYLIVRSEGPRQVNRAVKHYSLEAILAVGYRVRSQRGTQFRQWATTRLAECLVKGPDEVTGCASCARVVCARHQARCDVDKQVHCSTHLRRTDRARRVVCDKDRARCLHEPNAVFARDEIAECATCAADACGTHLAVCVIDGLRHCTTHLSPVKDRAGASACLPHQSRCHVDDVVFTIEGTTSCVCCGKAACSDHFKECDGGGRRLCVRDFSASSPQTCATCAKLVETMEIPDDILAASISVRGDGGQPKRWRMARDAGHREVEMDMGWTRRLTMSVPHGSSRADSVMAHSMLGRKRLRSK